MIYFIKSPDGPIKIGTTIRLTKRLRQLTAEYGEGLEVLAVTEGSFDVEGKIHSRFSHLRIVGEWFTPHASLLDFILSDGKPWDGTDDVSLTSPNRPCRLIEISDDGTKVPYYRKLDELTIEEGAQLLTYWNAQGRYADKQFRRYYRPLVKRHGRRIQRLLPFDLPKTAKA